MVTGYCEQMVKSDIDYVARATQRAELYDIIQTDLDNPYYLDDFIPCQAVLRHAQPKGKIIHVMAGNVPMAGLFTLLRSVITKNMTLIKLPSRDPVNVLMFAYSFLETDSEHPVSKSLTVAYWEPMNEMGREIMKQANAVCTWGKLDTMNNIRSLLKYGQEIIEFGPKRSIAVFLKNGDIESACMRLAYDMSIYDQEACFCPQLLFVQTKDLNDIVEPLQYYLNRMETIIPKVITPIDISAHLQSIILENMFMQNHVVKADSNQWTIILKNDIALPNEHPLSRTIYVYKFDHIDEIAPIVNNDMQTISVFPWNKYTEIAEKFTFLGARRIVETGLVNKPKLGFTHDGMKVLSRMVNWVCVEKGSDFLYKYGRFAGEQAEKFLYGGKREMKG